MGGALEEFELEAIKRRLVGNEGKQNIRTSQALHLCTYIIASSWTSSTH